MVKRGMKNFIEIHVIIVLNATRLHVPQFEWVGEVK